jgi:hypothetical protein
MGFHAQHAQQRQPGIPCADSCRRIIHFPGWGAQDFKPQRAAAAPAGAQLPPMRTYSNHTPEPLPCGRGRRRRQLCVSATAATAAVWEPRAQR